MIVDIDKFVEDFLADYDDDVLQEPPQYPPDWVWCPICMSGFIVSPVPGVLVCESCSEFKLGVPDNFNVSDLAPLLDSAIRAHADRHCPDRHRRPQFSINNNSLILHCSACSLSSIVL